jgi:mRNA interferase RelE/StbE
MHLTCNVNYKSSVISDLRKMEKDLARRIVDAIENDLANSPEKGQPLEGNFKGLYKYRVGSHRIIFARTGEDILVLRIGHRKKVYDR